MLDFLVRHNPGYIDLEPMFDMYITAWSSDLKRQLEDSSTGSVIHRLYIQCVLITAYVTSGCLCIGSWKDVSP